MQSRRADLLQKIQQPWIRSLGRWPWPYLYVPTAWLKSRHCSIWRRELLPRRHCRSFVWKLLQAHCPNSVDDLQHMQSMWEGLAMLFFQLVVVCQRKGPPQNSLSAQQFSSATLKPFFQEKHTFFFEVIAQDIDLGLWSMQTEPIFQYWFLFELGMRDRNWKCNQNLSVVNQIWIAVVVYFLRIQKK